MTISFVAYIAILNFKEENIQKIITCIASNTEDQYTKYEASEDNSIHFGRDVTGMKNFLKLSKCIKFQVLYRRAIIISLNQCCW